MKKISVFLSTAIGINSFFGLFALSSCSRQLNDKFLWITSDNAFSIYWKLDGRTGLNFPDIQYSDDYGLTWWKVSEDKPSIYFSKGRSIALKGYNPNGLSTQQTHFTMDIESTRDGASAKISGRIMSLIDNGTGKINEVPNDYCFYRLFNNNDRYNIVQEANLIFPTTLTYGCFSRMFGSCSKLHSLKVDFHDWNDAQQSFLDWLLDVSSNGMFNCPSDLDVNQRDSSHIPSGWQIKK